MPGPYATSTDYTARTGQAAPDDIDVRLVYASEAVDDALLTAVYEVDAQGMPTVPEVVEALRNAACDQVAFVLGMGGDLTGAAAQWDSVSLGPVSMSGRRGGAAGQGAGVELGPVPRRSLRLAGLLPGVIC